jgi:hypothetical protein
MRGRDPRLHRLREKMDFRIKSGNDAAKLERSQAKWKPVRRPETRQDKDLDSFAVSMKR